ncbi:MAG: AbrB/MazE/SpoVT family DNA-binding domain-containing protein [Acidobacteria bacterium]|nr:AbrB/MazE/SpoVT family DNA-binding domain-containing protein [Acidobacteriota bacterium]
MIAQSKLTAQGQISVPAEIRQEWGIEPGSVIQWEERAGEIVVRRAGRFSSQEIHQALFGGHPPRRQSLKRLKLGITQEIRRLYARD